MATIPGFRCSRNHVHASNAAARRCEEAPDYCSHTPGPWAINEGDGMAIAKVSMFAITAPCTADIGYLSKEENFANARLIAAAPDLLDALKAARDVLVAFQKQASYVPLQGYAATMTDAERRCAQAVSDIDSILQTADPRP